MEDTKDKALRAAIRLITLIRPQGHDGDEETGEHYLDCERCACDGVIYQCEYALGLHDEEVDDGR